MKRKSVSRKRKKKSRNYSWLFFIIGFVVIFIVAALFFVFLTDSAVEEEKLFEGLVLVNNRSISQEMVFAYSSLFLVNESRALELLIDDFLLSSYALEQGFVVSTSQIEEILLSNFLFGSGIVRNAYDNIEELGIKEELFVELLEIHLLANLARDNNPYLRFSSEDALFVYESFPERFVNEGVFTIEQVSFSLSDRRLSEQFFARAVREESLCATTQYFSSLSYDDCLTKEIDFSNKELSPALQSMEVFDIGLERIDNSFVVFQYLNFSIDGLFDFSVVEEELLQELLLNDEEAYNKFIHDLLLEKEVIFLNE